MKQSRKPGFWNGLIVLSLLLSLILSTAPAPVHGAARTVDGDPSDWTGTPSASAHTDAESNTEWIYTGVAGDQRTDSGMTADNDLTEMRLTTDGTYLYFLFRMSDIATANQVNIAVGIDTDQESTDTDFNFLGDETNLTMGRSSIRPERILNFHVAGSGNPEVEWYAGGSWYGIGGSQVSISTANDVVEARVPLSDLNGLTATSDFVLTAATFQNVAGWNNDIDSTQDFFGNDAVDTPGAPGQTGSAWSRDLNDNNIFFAWWIQLTGASSAPTAVVFDRLYHSSCTQPTASGCTAGDHPSVQTVPGEGSTTRFLSARRYSTDGTLAPVAGAVSDVYAYDDESVSVYFMAANEDLTVDGTYPRLRYTGTSTQYTPMAQASTWSGVWGGSPTQEYAIFNGTIPAAEPGNLYYSFVTRDESGDRSLCRTNAGSGAEIKGWLNQWVHESTCAANTEYTYAVIDDDITAPTIRNIAYTTGPDQVCATVYDLDTRSGDADSGLSTVQVRSSATQSDVTSGSGGTITPMSLSSGNTWCAALTLADNTYYRVEATNDDDDNGRAADRETGLSTIYCQGTGCVGNTASADNNIWWSEIYHNTRNLTYRNPFGAIPVSATDLTLRIQVADSDLTAANLMLYNSATGDHTIAMTKDVESDILYDWYSVVLPQTYFATPRIMYYKFQLIDGTDVDWYIDNYSHNAYDHEDRYENGEGMMVDDGLTSQYANNSFNITIYDDAAFSSTQLAEWAQNAVIYQIMPDRFRNGDTGNDGAAGWSYTDVYGNPAVYHPTWNEPVYDPRDPAGAHYQEWSRDFYGGDLQGIIDELDYLQNLGVTAIYLNPIFDSPSNHGYDTSNYLNINPRYGDNALFQSFAQLAEDRGIKIILDGVFNHTGSDSTYFDRYGRWAADGTASTAPADNASGGCESAASPFDSFYTFNAATSSAPCRAGTATYESWWGYDTLPLLNENNAVYEYIFDMDGDGSNGMTPSNKGVIQFWTDLGVDGWRFDVADEISHDFWQKFRTRVKANPDQNIGPLFSEVWYEATPWILGDQMDATMNYRYRKAVLGFLIDSTWTDNDNNSDQTMWKLSPSQFDYALNSIREDYPQPSWYSMMNLMDSHDTNRALFVIGEKSTNDTEAIAKMKMMAALQFTYPGSPTIYYGDETGLGLSSYGGYGTWGAGKTYTSNVQDDPYNRASYPWSDQSGTLPAGLPNASLQETYRLLANARSQYDVLRTGDVITLMADDSNNIYAYARVDSNGTPDCAIAIFNRSASAHTVTLDISSPALLACQNETFENLLDGGTNDSSDGTSIQIDNIPALSSAVLLQSVDYPDSGSGLPPAAITLSAVQTIAAGGNTSVTAAVTDLAGQPLNDGAQINFELLSGTGSIPASGPTAQGNGEASVTLQDTDNGYDMLTVHAWINLPDGKKVETTMPVFAGYKSTVSAWTSYFAGIGPDIHEFGSLLTNRVEKSGLGEPFISISVLNSNPFSVETDSGRKSEYLDVAVSSPTGVDSVKITLACSPACDTVNDRIYVGQHTAPYWVQVGGTRGVDWDITATEAWFIVTSTSSPSLADLNGTPFVVTGSTPTAVQFVTAKSNASIPVAASLLLIPLALCIFLVWRKRHG